MKLETITYDDFAKLDMRIGEVLSVDGIKGSEKLLALQVDLGEDYGEVEILAGVAKWYTAEDLVGKKFIFLANLTPRAMMGKTSNGMMFAADGEEKPILIPVDQNLASGSSIR